MKTASDVTYIVSNGALNSTPTPNIDGETPSVSVIDVLFYNDNTIQYNTKFVKRHVAVASEALANRTVKKHRRRRTNVL